MPDDPVPGTIEGDVAIAAAAVEAEAAAAAAGSPEEQLAAAKAELETANQALGLQSEQIELYKANQSPGGPVEPTPTDPTAPEFEGLKDDDVITVGELKKIMGGQDARYGGVVTELEFKTQHSNFDAVIEKYLPGVVKGRPDLTRAMRTSGNPALLAYELVTKCPEYLKDEASGKLSEAEKEAVENAAKIKANAAKPGAASGVPGGGAGEEGVNFILKMSDSDLEDRIANIKAKESA